MSNQQLDEEAIFHTARRIEHEDVQQEYLDQVCAGDQALRERVRSLLEIDQREREFLKSKTPEPEPTIDTSSLAERSGASIGRYRLMEQIGEGGMGVVFVAEQKKPLRRKVALKVIKPGMDSKAVIGRFEAERQALALMDHPNIAKVLAPAGMSQSLETLRSRGLSASSSAAQGREADAKRTVYERSRAVRSYVLARAKGICESCHHPAPFRRKGGSPYLEPHHTRRVSDGGQTIQDGSVPFVQIATGKSTSVTRGKHVIGYWKITWELSRIESDMTTLARFRLGCR